MMDCGHSHSRGRAHTQRPQRAHVTSMTQVRAVAELTDISHTQRLTSIREGEPRGASGQREFEDTREGVSARALIVFRHAAPK